MGALNLIAADRTLIQLLSIIASLSAGVIILGSIERGALCERKTADASDNADRDTDQDFHAESPFGGSVA